MTVHFQDVDRSQQSRAGRTVARLRPPRSGLYRNGLKRGLDVMLVVAAAPFVLCFVLMLAAIVALEGGQPFYAQPRIGRGGQIFRMWKLRTMQPGADIRLAEYLASSPAAYAEWTLNQKLSDDPRVTRTGQFLRRTSLDELPQLWNVLVGDMSLVGPRPMMPEQEALYPGRAYYTLRPGITGSWQVSARNRSTFADRAAFDTEYEEILSLGTDLRCLLATVRVVAKGTGC
jgi:lipopolysaccharide/colanic/teichoic acid biosynthesis glycosyltransferase